MITLFLLARLARALALRQPSPLVLARRDAPLASFALVEFDPRPRDRSLQSPDNHPNRIRNTIPFRLRGDGRNRASLSSSSSSSSSVVVVGLSRTRSRRYLRPNPSPRSGVVVVRGRGVRAVPFARATVVAFAFAFASVGPIGRSGRSVGPIGTHPFAHAPARSGHPSASSHSTSHDSKITSDRDTHSPDRDTHSPDRDTHIGTPISGHPFVLYRDTYPFAHSSDIGTPIRPFARPIGTSTSLSPAPDAGHSTKHARRPNAKDDHRRRHLDDEDDRAPRRHRRS